MFLCSQIKTKAMQTTNILSATLEDLIFDGRNKAYGAYELRVHYERRIKKSLVLTFTIVALVIGSTVLAGSMKKKEIVYKVVPGVVLTDIPPEKLIEKPVEATKPPEEKPVKSEKLIENIIIVDKDELIDPPPSQIDLSDAVISDVKIDGEKFDNIPKPEVISKGIATGILVKPENDPEVILTTVEIEAKYEGDWIKFLLRNLNAEIPIQHNAPAGNHTIIIQFVVDKEGNVSDIKPITNIGYGMEQEAVRVIKKATKWKAAIQNGYAVKAFRRQPITFQVLNDE